MKINLQFGAEVAVEEEEVCLEFVVGGCLEEHLACLEPEMVLVAAEEFYLLLV